MSPRSVLRNRLSALAGAILLLSSAQHALSQAALDAFDKADKERQKLDKRLDAVSPKYVTPKGGSGDLDADLRRRKEEAAESLTKTLKDIDERAKTKAIEGGKGVIIQ